MASLSARVAFLNEWIERGQPACFSVPSLFFPQAFITALFQQHARRHNVAICSLHRFHSRFRREEAGADVSEPPSEGVCIDGLCIEGARWDRGRQKLADSAPAKMHERLPVIHLLPTQDERTPRDYACPLYRTAERRGHITATGTSTNFVMDIDVPTDKDPDDWVRAGVAMLCEVVTE